MKCSSCEFQAVVYDTYHRNVYCPGHAMVYLKSMIDAVKDDKFEFLVIADAIEKGLIEESYPTITVTVSKRWYGGLSTRCANALIAEGFHSKGAVREFLNNGWSLRLINNIGAKGEKEILEWLDKDQTP